MCGIHTRGVIGTHLTSVQVAGQGFSGVIPPKFEYTLGRHYKDLER